VGDVGEPPGPVTLGGGYMLPPVLLLLCDGGRDEEDEEGAEDVPPGATVAGMGWIFDVVGVEMDMDMPCWGYEPPLDVTGDCATGEWLVLLLP
jgi:hypothetical protein